MITIMIIISNMIKIKKMIEKSKKYDQKFD